MPPVFVGARDLSALLDVRYETVLSWVRRGRIPYARDGRGRYLFNLDTVFGALRHEPHKPRNEAAGRGVSQ